jgi:hypothetical protein
MLKGYFLQKFTKAHKTSEAIRVELFYLLENNISAILITANKRQRNLNSVGQKEEILSLLVSFQA